MAVDPFPVPNGQRSERALGTAMEVAVTIMEGVDFPNCSKLICFTGGPATRGPGAIVSLGKEEMMRSHRDFQNGDIPHYKKAVAFYSDMEKRLTSAGVSVDCFVASYDQVGIMEMRSCINGTGGSFICVDSFDDVMFEESLMTYCTRRLGVGGRDEVPEDGVYKTARCGFNVNVEVHTSCETLISGAVGPCKAVPVTQQVSSNC
eukprot:Tbor_TRINITY_DN5495_c1_g3::TRINITY_DN5495_c1_g3_i1::g.24263::m.24263/K14006/SEC23; protein transport protein SEC23